MEKFYYLRKVNANSDRALYKHNWYSRFYREDFPTPSQKGMKLYTTKRLSTILRQRDALHEYSNEWFDVYDQDNKKIDLKEV